MKINRRVIIRWVTLGAVSGLAFTGGWFSGHGTAREVAVDPSHACLSASQYGSIILERERREGLILLNQEERSDAEVQELYLDNLERKDRAIVLKDEFDRKCQKDLQEDS